MGALRLSVVVPVRNGGAFLGRCLDCLAAARPAADEVIVVLDGCDDDSAAIARRAGVRVLQTPRPSGPAAARNLGARAARGAVLYFVDADVAIPPGAIAEVLAAFREEPEIAAVFGSYDDEPAHRNLVSLYKNLLHHHVHQSGRDEASTFWSGSGAIRRNVFLRVGGFDERFARPSIEDIELGARLTAAGHRIRLRRALQVKHLKRYRLLALLRSDVVDRAVPWSGLILRRQQMPGDLNLDWPSRASAVLACAIAPCLALGAGSRLGLGLALACAGGLIALNRRFYGLVRRRAGWLAAAAAGLLHWLYFVYGAATFALCAAAHVARRAAAALGGEALPAPPLPWPAVDDAAAETLPIAASNK